MAVPLTGRDTGGVSAAAAIELYWIPVGAGTSRFQRASLRLWEAIEAARSRRPRAVLVHAALKLHPGGETSTLELMPAFVARTAPALVTGPVGLGPAGRLRLFRYELRHIPAARLPDEQWAFGPPIPLGEGPGDAARVLALAPEVPAYTWGRRARGTSEMWTSDSVVSWLLCGAGIPLAGAGPPPGARAPGWRAGIEIARRPMDSHRARARA